MFFSSDPAKQAWLELPDGGMFWLRERVTIGRQAGNDLVLSSDTLSRQHALITVGATGYSITDMQSRNGTYVAGNLINRPVILHDADEVRRGTAFKPGEALAVTRTLNEAGLHLVAKAG